MTGIGFQLPLVILILNRLGVLEYKTLVGGRKYAIVIILVIAAFLTPPDVISQIILALPLYFLFELGVVITFFAEKRKKKKEVKAALDMSIS
jgi:sec-independent protein translocase protein TatC